MNSKITIITVCLNAENTIRQTIESVLTQKYTNVEYIVIDGNSSDSTNVIVRQYEDLFHEKGYSFLHFIENDKGIFDAMNKGIQRATGDWVNFLNADDVFYDENVLTDVFGEDNEGVDCIYGDVISKIGSQKNYRKALPIETITYRNPYVHQALFCRKDVLIKYLFDLQYKYSADFDQAVRLYLDGRCFRHISRPIVIFSLEGCSQKNFKVGPKEFERIRKKNGISKRNILKRYLIYLGVYVIKSNPLLFKMYARINEELCNESTSD